MWEPLSARKFNAEFQVKSGFDYAIHVGDVPQNPYEVIVAVGYGEPPRNQNEVKDVVYVSKELLNHLRESKAKKAS